MQEDKMDQESPISQLDGVDERDDPQRKRREVEEENSNHDYTQQLSKRVKSTTSLSFDPIEEHRWLCPWIKEQPGQLEGWKLLLTSLSTTKSESNSFQFRGTHDLLSKVRSLLG
jgi:hypothetical protein